MQEPTRRPVRRRKRRKGPPPVFYTVLVLLLVAAIVLVVRAIKDKPEGGESAAGGSGSSSASQSGAGNIASSGVSSVPSGSEPGSQPSEPDAPANNPIGLPAYEPDDDWQLLLVNNLDPKRRLTEELDVELESFDSNFVFDARAIDSLRALFKAAEADGQVLFMVSTHRTFARSEYLYNQQIQSWMAEGLSRAEAEKEAARWVAPPGTSEHNTGLAADIVSHDYYSHYDNLYDKFEEFDEFEWLQEHAEEYGFVLRYPKDKQEITGITYEPWHYRYVGVKNARYMNEHNLCLEEYVELLEANGILK